VTPKRRRSGVYWRLRGGAKRAYGDFRDYADVGGHQEALIAPGERLATTDPDVADLLATSRLRDLDALRRGRALHGCAHRTPLAAYAAEHLEKKARGGKVTRDWIAMAELFLRRAVDFSGRRLNALSNLFRRAQSEGLVPPGFSPVSAMMEKPAGVRREARWLEVPDAALLLESARTLPSSTRRDALPGTPCRPHSCSQGRGAGRCSALRCRMSRSTVER
jgi:hypothetical protein